MAISTAQGLALVRAGTGLYFLVSALRKLTGGWLTSPDQMMQFLQKNGEQMPATYAGFIDNVVAPNAGTFALLIALGETVVGVSLLLGLLTRVGSIVAVWLLANFMLAKGLPNFEGSMDRLMLLMCIVFGAAAAGLTWGLDGALRPWLAANPLTSWLAGIHGPARRPIEVLPDRRERRRAA
jgi:thiosulfate dehydrogenase (quinone) large subunit